jgi:hypothetical protein
LCGGGGGGTGTSIQSKTERQYNMSQPVEKRMLRNKFLPDGFIDISK